MMKKRKGKEKIENGWKVHMGLVGGTRMTMTTTWEMEIIIGNWSCRIVALILFHIHHPLNTHSLPHDDGWASVTWGKRWIKKKKRSRDVEQAVGHWKWLLTLTGRRWNQPREQANKRTGIWLEFVGSEFDSKGDEKGKGEETTISSLQPLTTPPTPTLCVCVPTTVRTLVSYVRRALEKIRGEKKQREH